MPRWVWFVTIGALAALGIEVFLMWDSTFEHKSTLIQIATNGVVAIFTLGLWGATLYQSRQTKASVDVAISTLDITRAGQRAYVFIVPSEKNTALDWRGGIDTFKWSFAIWNHGTTPAIIKGIDAAVSIATTPPHLSRPDPRIMREDEFASHSTVEPVLGGKFILSSGASSPEFELHGDRAPLNMKLEYPDERRKKIEILKSRTSPASGQIWFWMRCVVRYEDIYGVSHETAGCFYLDSGHNSYSEHGGHEMNYRT